MTGSIHILEELIVGGRELSQFVGDFTWYMRNLLLVKTSENPEEAIDVSSDNMKLLKEEGTMLDVETLMRYIPYFFGFVQPDPICNPEKGSRGDCTDQVVPSCNGD